MNFQRAVSVLAQLAASLASSFHSHRNACGAPSPSSTTFTTIVSPIFQSEKLLTLPAMCYRHKYQVNKSPLCAHCDQASWRFNSTQTTQKTCGLTQDDTHSSPSHEQIPTILWEDIDGEKR